MADGRVHQIMHVDLETYSSVDLTKTSVYRYSESPDFQILLFGYAFDDEPVEVIDLTKTTLPDHIRAALQDPNILKLAFNANFERVCLSHYLETYLGPEQWQCVQVHAATLGLPRTLAEVGKVLGLPEDKQKMSEGKALIQYFCKPCRPTKANGGRTRNLPHHDVAKWHTFIAYNQRDVETEREIRYKLDAFPVHPDELKAYWMDQRINDRGVLVDERLMEAAIRMNYEHAAELSAEAQGITGLENVNSVAQLKRWLNVEGTLDKKAVKAMRDKGLPEAADRVLAIRQELGKTSVSKYEAMQRGICEDGRVRGLFAFYGANRTGRWCLTGDHEVLTLDGWKRLDEWKGGEIACWKPDEVISFQPSKAQAFPYEGMMYHYLDKRIDQISTPEHRMYVKRRYDGAWETDTVENMASYRPSIPFTGELIRRHPKDNAALRVLIMVQADGHYTEDGQMRLAFKKERKIERCKRLLRAAEIPYTLNTYPDHTVFVIPSRCLPLYLRQFTNKTFGWWMLQENPDVVFDELRYWDGYQSAPNSIQYVSTNRQNADIIQALAHLSGRSALLTVKEREEEKWSTAYYVDIWENPKNCHEIRNKPTLEPFSGTVYCPNTPTGYFLVRRNRSVWVTGNSGRQVQVQNLPQNHIPDLELAREIVKSGDRNWLQCLYGNVPNVLSELIRTAFIAKPGHTYCVADFSAIEARVSAWMADEKWVTKAFADGQDIYCTTASQMFHVPVEKHGVNAHLRQKGKIATLACGYGGSVGAMTAMGALEMGIPEAELQSIVDAWRASNGHIVDLWWQIDAAARDTITSREPRWRYDLPHGLSMRYARGLLHVRLPSGREIRYWHPEVVEDGWRGKITYDGVEIGKWARIETYGPKIFENIVQATARDCLRDAMLQVEKRYPGIVMHIHDEMVVEVPKYEAEEALAYMLEVMSTPVSWAPGLILKGDGYITGFYKKD